MSEGLGWGRQGAHLLLLLLPPQRIQHSGSSTHTHTHTLKCTFGWKTFVRKRTEGGTSGYCSGTLMASSNTPPSNGVSLGPCARREAGSHSGMRRSGQA